MEKKRIGFYDFWKGICICMVLVTHYAWTDIQRLNPVFPFLIEMAVPIFMIIMGILWSKSIMDKYGNFGGGYRIEYILHKIVLFSIPFFICYIVESIVYTLVYGWNGKMMVLILLQGGMGPGSYYYPILLQMLCIFPVILYLIIKYDFCGLIFCFGINLLYEILKTAYGMNESCYRLLAFRYIFVISVGCYIYVGKKKIPNIIRVLSFLAGSLFIVIMSYTAYSPKVFTYWTGTSMLACLYICPIMMFIYEKLQNVSQKGIEVLGRASYEIFLVQMVYYWCVPTVLYKVVESVILRLCINGIVIVCCGLVFYKITGKLIQWINKRIRYDAIKISVHKYIDFINREC